MKKVLLVVNSIEKDYSNIINELMNKGYSLIVVPYSKYLKINNISTDILIMEENHLFNNKRYTISELKGMLFDNSFNDKIVSKLTLIISYLENNKKSLCLFGTIDNIMNGLGNEIIYGFDEITYTNVTIVTDFYCKYNDEKYVAYIRDNRSFYVSKFILKEGKMILLDIEDENVTNDLKIFSIALKIVLGIVNKEHELSSVAKTVLDNCGFIIDGDNPNLQSIRTVVSREENELKIY